MLSTNNLAFAIKQKEVNHSVDDLMVVQSQILNRDSNGKVMVEKLPSTDHSRGGFHIPGIMLKYGEHPEDGAHRVLTEELEVADRPVRLIDVQSHAGEKNSWYLIFLFENNILHKEGIIILHRHKNTDEKMPNYFKLIDERKYGGSKIIFGKFSF